MDLTELTDRLLIAELLSTYCDVVDRSDIDGLIDLYAEDITIDMGHGAVFSGRAQLRSLLIDRVGLYETTNHHTSNLRILRYDGTSADTLSYLYVFHDDPARDLTMHLWGRYEDELVKQDGTWLFRARRLRVAGVEETSSSPTPDRFERFSRVPLPTQ